MDEVAQEERELRKELRRAIKIYVIFWSIAYFSLILFYILKYLMGW
jgi:hypothetical protein